MQIIIKLLTSVDFFDFWESFDFLRGRGDFLNDLINVCSGLARCDEPVPPERPDGVGLNSFDSLAPILIN